MSASIEVLCLNGRRQHVKVTPNTKLLQVLEEVCLKQDYQPSAQYALKHNRKLLDLTLSVRFAGLANLAKLELVKHEGRTESDVTVALQLESGQRIQEDFPPGTTLWKVLSKLGEVGSQQNDSHPVCIYLREEIVGQYALENTTLRRLGLTSGSAIIRLVYRSVPDATLYEVHQRIDKENARLEGISAKSNRGVATLPHNSDTSKSSDQTVSLSEAVLPAAAADLQFSMQSSEPPLLDPLKYDWESRGHSVVSSAFDQSGQTAVAFESDDFERLSSREQQRARQLAARIAPQFFGDLPEDDLSTDAGCRRSPRSVKRAVPQIQPDFKFPEETKGQDLYRNELSVVTHADEQVCEREPMMFSLATNRPELFQADEVSEEFYDVTENDIRKQWADIQKNNSEQQNAPLMTSSMRQAINEAKLASYSHVVLRVTFPDQLVLQGFFKPKETVAALYNFVREHISEAEKPFYLYVTPPKRVLPNDGTKLFETDLVPMAVIYFGSEHKRERYFNDQTLSETSALQADMSIRKRMSKNAAYPAVTANPETYVKPSLTESKPEAASSTSSGSRANSGLAPKWFKLGPPKP